MAMIGVAAIQDDCCLINGKRRRLDDDFEFDEPRSCNNKRRKQHVETKKQQLDSVFAQDDDPLFTDAARCQLPLYLSQLALTHANMTKYAANYKMNKNEFYEGVYVVKTSTLASAVDNPTVYVITFQAFLPADKTTQTFFTKVVVTLADTSHPTTKIRFVSIDIKGEDDEENYLSVYYSEPVSKSDDDGQSDENPPESDDGEDSEDLSESNQKDSEEDLSESSQKDSEESLFKSNQKDSEEGLSESNQQDSEKGLSESSQKESEYGLSKSSQKDSEEGLSESNQKDSEEGPSESSQKDSEDGLSESSQKYSKEDPSESNQKDSEEGLSESNQKDSEDLSKSHHKDSEKILSEFDKQNSKTVTYGRLGLTRCFGQVKTNTKELMREIKSFNDDLDKSDGFEVGYYPLMKAAGIHGTWLFKFYDIANTTLCATDMNKLVCLSQLALCVYNMKENTYFDKIKVLKAMTSGCAGTKFNITFEASSLDKKAEIFRTRLVESYPRPHRNVEIMFVRTKDN